MPSLPVLSADDADSLVHLVRRRIEEISELRDGPVSDFLVAQMADLLAAAPDAETAATCVAENVTRIYRLGDRRVWRLATRHGGAVLVDAFPHLETAIQHESENLSFDRLELAIAEGGLLRSADMRAQVLVSAWSRKRLDLQDAVRRAGGLADDHRGLTFVNNIFDESPANALLPACFGPTLRPMLALAARQNRTAFRLFLRHIARREDLPSPDDLEAPVRALIAQLSTAHGFIAWRRESRDWLVRKLASHPEILAGLEADEGGAILAAGDAAA